jgi:hypothetical protein
MDVVYLKIQHPQLRRLWWKPDYPIEQFGFNPHITIYAGRDSRAADLVERFLQRENLRIVCTEIRIVSHVSDHRDLFEHPAAYPSVLMQLMRRGVVDPLLPQRIQRLKAQVASKIE